MDRMPMIGWGSFGENWGRNSKKLSLGQQKTLIYEFHLVNLQYRKLGIERLLLLGIGCVKVTETCGPA